VIVNVTDLRSDAIVITATRLNHCSLPLAGYEICEEKVAKLQRILEVARYGTISKSDWDDATDNLN
jgi:hypothetical protein